MTLRCCLPHPIKQNCLLKTFLRTLILMTHIFLPDFFSRASRKLHNISGIPKLVKKVITNLYSSKTSSPDCVPVVVLLCKFEPGLSCILAELFNMCLKEYSFPDCLKV